MVVILSVQDACRHCPVTVAHFYLSTAHIAIPTIHRQTRVG